MELQSIEFTDFQKKEKGAAEELAGDCLCWRGLWLRSPGYAFVITFLYTPSFIFVFFKTHPMPLRNVGNCPFSLEHFFSNVWFVCDLSLCTLASYSLVEWNLRKKVCIYNNWNSNKEYIFYYLEPELEDAGIHTPVDPLYWGGTEFL